MSSTSLVDNANAVPLINAFPQDKLSHLVRRILQAPHQTNGGFNSEEQQQLMEMGHMSPAQMQSFIDTLEHTFARAGSDDWDDRQVLDSLTSTGISDKSYVARTKHYQSIAQCHRESLEDACNNCRLTVNWAGYPYSTVQSTHKRQL
ncbi:hypothetical protein Ae201684P_004640 [Aphanomyces euteiches]|nr:hypothetical protein Ae201684P_004640 [Aphanomyces euteiches]